MIIKETDFVLWALWVASNKETLSEIEFRQMVPGYVNDIQMKTLFFENWIQSKTFNRDILDIKYILDRVQRNQHYAVGRLSVRAV